jgi:uncharacterized protein with FMN-binding domain
MKRAFIATCVTVAGVAWIVGYRVVPHSSGLIAAAGPANPQPTPVTSPAAPGTAATPAPAPAGTSGTFSGQDVPNRFGDVQVQVVVANGRITEVKALQLPSDRAQSAYISQVAGPMLRSEALQAQSAKIDIISGATYTSVSYAQSLESALQQAHLG